MKSNLRSKVMTQNSSQVAIKPKKVCTVKSLKLVKSFLLGTGIGLRHSMCMACNYHGPVWEETDLMHSVCDLWSTTVTCKHGMLPVNASTATVVESPDLAI